MTSSSSRRRSVNVGKRLEILQKLEKGISTDRVIAEYGASKRTIHRCKKDSATIRQLSENPMCINSKRQRVSLYENMETQLYKWVLKRRALGDTITNALLQEKAKELHSEFGNSSNFTASQGWLSRFKNRYNICLVNIYEEKTDTNRLAAQEFIDVLADMLLHEGFEEKNIYNMSESSLMWRAVPQKLIIDKSEQQVRTRVKKDLVTVAFCSNATGKHKLPLLFVNKHANPKALKHCKYTFPLVYKYQSNSCVNEHLFNDWYINDFKLCVRQKQLLEHRMGKVLLIVNNFKGHKIPKEAWEDNSFKLIFLPCNTSSLLQPMNQDVITKCKKLFRFELIHRVLRYNHGIKEFYANYDIKDCIDLITESWNKITEENIENSRKKLLKRQPLTKGSEMENTDSNIGKRNLDLKQAISSEQIAEWMLKCEVAELGIGEGIEQAEQEANPASDCPIEEEEIDSIFYHLENWVKTESEFIKLHAKALIDHYNKK